MTTRAKLQQTLFISCTFRSHRDSICLADMFNLSPGRDLDAFTRWALSPSNILLNLTWAQDLGLGAICIVSLQHPSVKLHCRRWPEDSHNTR